MKPNSSKELVGMKKNKSKKKKKTGIIQGHYHGY